MVSHVVQYLFIKRKQPFNYLNTYTVATEASAKSWLN